MNLGAKTRWPRVTLENQADSRTGSSTTFRIARSVGTDDMDLYRLRAVLREPSDDTEGKYLAEIPDLPGCRAWGDSP